MTNKQTIDGVSRDTIQRIADHCKFWIDHPYLEAIADVEVELRALLDKPDTPYVPKGDWSFDYIAGGDIVIRNGKDWTLIKRGSGPIYEQFLYRFCEEQMKPAAQPQGEPVAMTIPDECPHIIVFDDADREQLVFAGAGARSAAQKTWEQISGSWNAHLFVRIERNSRDDRYPSAL